MDPGWVPGGALRNSPGVAPDRAWMTWTVSSGPDLSGRSVSGRDLACDLACDLEGVDQRAPGLASIRGLTGIDVAFGSALLSISIARRRFLRPMRAR